MRKALKKMEGYSQMSEEEFKLMAQTIIDGGETDPKEIRRDLELINNMLTLQRVNSLRTRKSPRLKDQLGTLIELRLLPEGEYYASYDSRARKTHIIKTKP